MRSCAEGVYSMHVYAYTPNCLLVDSVEQCDVAQHHRRSLEPDAAVSIVIEGVNTHYEGID